MEQYILAHDFGTSADKASLFNTEGEFIRTVTTAYPTNHSHSTWAEQDPEDWWQAFCSSTKTLLEGIDIKNVLCVAFDGTFPNCIPVDKEGKPTYPAIIWQDMRAEKEANELTKLIPAQYLTYGGEGIMRTEQSLPKLLWLKRNRPEAFSKTYKMLATPSDYIILRLTGNFVCEYSMANSMGTLDLANRIWSKDSLEAAGITEEMMPTLHACTDVVGEVPEGSLSQECGLFPGTKLVIGTGDATCSSIGAGNISIGDACLTGGSSAGISAVIPAEAGSGYHSSYLPKGASMMGGMTMASGSAYSWVKNEICKIEQKMAEENGKSAYDYINEEVASAPLGANGVLFLPLLKGERSPFYNPKAKGSFLGITLANTRADLLRAVVEGIGFNIALILEDIRQHYDFKKLTMVGGLAKSDVVRQIFADIMGVELVTLKYMDEVATVGAAIMGGIAIGIYEDYSAVRKFHAISARNLPNMENHAKYQKLLALYKKGYEAQIQLFEAMAE